MRKILYTEVALSFFSLAAPTGQERMGVDVFAGVKHHGGYSSTGGRRYGKSMEVKYCQEVAQGRIFASRIPSKSEAVEPQLFLAKELPGGKHCDNHTGFRAESIKTMWHLQPCRIHTMVYLARQEAGCWNLFHSGLAILILHIC